jgi:folate-dependent tRNA-U54 methylase TrmFO/GidA
MNMNFGLFPALGSRAPKLPRRDRNLRISHRALQDLEAYRSAVEPEPV